MPYSVIIIDDHSLFNDGLALILGTSSIKKFEVIEQIYDSRESIKKIIALQPDLVLIDFNMPHLDGLEVVRELKQTMIWGKVKVVILSIYSDNKHIKSFKDEGVNAYLLKDTPADELIDSLDKVMGGERFFAGSHEKTNQKFNDDFGKKYFLTTQERVILKCLKKGMTSVEMGIELNLSPHTIKTHRKNIKRKLGFETSGEFQTFLHENEF